MPPPSRNMLGRHRSGRWGFLSPGPQPGQGAAQGPRRVGKAPDTMYDDARVFCRVSRRSRLPGRDHLHTVAGIPEGHRDIAGSDRTDRSVRRERVGDEEDVHQLTSQMAGWLGL